MSTTEPKDKNILCKDCGVEFRHSVCDQEFYTNMGFQEPKKCRPCRNAAKARREGR